MIENIFQQSDKQCFLKKWVKSLRHIILSIICIWTPLLRAQPSDLVLQDTTVTTEIVFTATQTITAGPNFSISDSGDVTFVSGDYVYLRPGFTVLNGGQFKAIMGTPVNHITEIPETWIEFGIQQNYPNPFNPVTHILYSIPASDFVIFQIYDILGKEVATLVNEKKTPGEYEVIWDGHGFPSGIYFYRLKAGERVETRKLILQK